MAESTRSGAGGVHWQSLFLGLGIGCCGLAAVMYRQNRLRSVVHEEKKKEEKEKPASLALSQAKPKSISYNFGLGQHVPTPRAKHGIDNTQYLVKPTTM